MDICYWRSGDGHICVNSPCTKGSVPIIGQFTGNEGLEVLRWITGVQEQALDRDRYEVLEILPDPDLLALTTDEKRAILMEKKNEKPIYYLSDIYKGISINSLRDFHLKAQTFFEHGRVFSGSSFLPIVTPAEFNYTGVFLANNPYQGVLHSFLRHFLQWQIIVPAIEVIMERLRPVRLYIEMVEKAPNIRTSREAISHFVKAMKELDKADFNECQSALNEIQLQMVQHLQQKLIYSNYRGEGLNEKTQMEVFFRMQDGLIIVLGFSRELFKPEVTLFNSRPVRALVTAYFIDPEEHSKRLIVKSY